MIPASLSLSRLLAEVDWKWMSAFRAYLKLQILAAPMKRLLAYFIAKPSIGAPSEGPSEGPYAKASN